ncbi:hypothetical protein L2E82_10866 [Cichorium intybus]|uniref:Uncharacterized protein n=1 Tax=Cichorium intybus TaxID=13427 RepID=A0ACB9GCS9_CICIN|nr:hypothetical protein L2E82_10866 [Cichorium intybus]
MECAIMDSKADDGKNSHLTVLEKCDSRPFGSDDSLGDQLICQLKSSPCTPPPSGSFSILGAPPFLSGQPSPVTKAPSPSLSSEPVQTTNLEPNLVFSKSLPLPVINNSYQNHTIMQLTPSFSPISTHSHPSVQLNSSAPTPISLLTHVNPPNTPPPVDNSKFDMFAPTQPSPVSFASVVNDNVVNRRVPVLQFDL